MIAFDHETGEWYDRCAAMNNIMIDDLFWKYDGPLPDLSKWRCDFRIWTPECPSSPSVGDLAFESKCEFGFIREIDAKTGAVRIDPIMMRDGNK